MAEHKRKFTRDMEDLIERRGLRYISDIWEITVTDPYRIIKKRISIIILLLAIGLGITMFLAYVLDDYEITTTTVLDVGNNKDGYVQAVIRHNNELIGVPLESKLSGKDRLKEGSKVDIKEDFTGEMVIIKVY